MSKLFYCSVVVILGILIVSQQASAVWFFNPFNFRPIYPNHHHHPYTTTTTTTTTTTAAPVTDTTTTAVTDAPTTTVSTTPTAVQVSAGFVTGQVFNQTGGATGGGTTGTGSYFPFQQQFPFGGNTGGNFPTIGGLSRPLFSGFPFFGGLARPLGFSNGGGFPVIGGIASPNGK